MKYYCPLCRKVQPFIIHQAKFRSDNFNPYREEIISNYWAVQDIFLEVESWFCENFHEYYIPKNWLSI